MKATAWHGNAIESEELMEKLKIGTAVWYFPSTYGKFTLEFRKAKIVAVKETEQSGIKYDVCEDRFFQGEIHESFVSTDLNVIVERIKKAVDLAAQKAMNT